jgi:regulator of cell morphogenesis and NO signaling
LNSSQSSESPQYAALEQEPMGLTPATTLAEIAANQPSMVREMERLGLDYCCGGDRSLEEACRQQRLDPDLIVAKLMAGIPPHEAPAEWSNMSPLELVNHLEATHHRYLKAELPRLSELSAQASRVHGQKHPELIRVAEVYTEIRADLEPHLRKEEEVLFPMIRSLSTGDDHQGVDCRSIANTIAAMEKDHIVVGGLLGQLRLLTDGYQAPADTCTATQALMRGLAELEADTHLHVHKENNHLFPAVIAMSERLKAVE